MKHLWKWALVLAILALAVPTGLPAQQLSKGSVQGTVTDATGAVVPDAKVVVSSSLYGTREAKTDAEGRFLFLGLEPGKYSIRVEKEGFKAYDLKDVDIRLNERANVSVKLEIGVVTQVVEVSEMLVSIDTSTTASGGSVTSSLFLNTPVGRNITDIPYLVAGVNDSLGVGAANPSISGATGFENVYIVNGVNITNPGYGAIGTYSNVYGSLGSGVQFDFVKEVQVKTSGFEAQYGQALGGVVNMITKSGGNQLRGGAYFYLAPQVFELARLQPNAVRFNRATETTGTSTYDLGGEVGGYFIKDRAFWYGGFNAIWTRNTIQGPDNFRSRTLVGEHILPTRVNNYSAKLNLNLTADQRHQLEGSLFGDPTSTDKNFNRGLVTDYPDRRTSKLEYGSRNWTIRYIGAFTNTWLVNASFNWAHNEFKEKDFQDIYQVEDRTEALPTTVNSVGDGLPNPSTSRGLNQIGGLGFYENNNGDNKQFVFGGTNTFRLFGGHQVDYGYQFENVDYDWFHRRTGPDWKVLCTRYDGTVISNVTPSDCGQTVYGAAMRLRTGGAAGYRLQQTRGAFTGQTGLTHTKYHALYLQDAFNVNKWITLKLGVRWEQQRIEGEVLGYTFAGNWSPRLGVIVDPWADRKTKFFFNFGRFYEKIPQDLAVRSLSEERSYLSYFFAVTNPLSANPRWNSAVNPTAGCPASTPATQAGLASCLNNPANWILDVAHNITGTPVFSGGVTNFAAGTKAQYQDEYVVGFERELRGGVFISARYLDRRIQRVVEDVAGLTVGGANWGSDIFGGTIEQTFLLANPSRSLDIFHNTLCNNGTGVTTEDPTQEDNDPNSANFALGCLVSGGGDPGYNPGSGSVGFDGLPDGFPNPVRRYRAFEFSIEKRFTKNWQLSGNWRMSKLDGNYEGLYRNDNGQTDPNITSLFDFPYSNNLGDQFTPGPLPTDRRHVANVYASYLFDNGLNIGTGWRVMSGYPLDRLRAHPAYLNQGEVPVGGRGSEGRSLVTSTIDAHADYAWKMTERYHMRFGVDIFNLWNARRIRRIDRNEDTGFVSGQVPALAPNVDFLKVTGAADAYQRPLYARFSIRLEF